jgi:hypothetical protein
MPASFDVVWDYGGSDGSPGTTKEVVTNVRLKRADDNTQDTNNPTPIPGAGFSYSYWKHLYLNCTTAPDTQCDNFRIYSDGTVFDTDVNINIGLQFPTPTTGYELANSTTAMEAADGHSLISTVTTIDNYTSGSPLSVDITPGDSIIDAVNETTDYVLLQLKVGSGASPGLKAAETITFVYDEI